MTELTVTLPDDLAIKAKAAGLLSSEGIERALREVLKREAGRKLLAIGKEMQASDIPPMTEEETAKQCRRANEPAALAGGIADHGSAQRSTGIGSLTVRRDDCRPRPGQQYSLEGSQRWHVLKL